MGSNLSNIGTPTPRTACTAGVSVLAEQSFESLRGQRVGLLTHDAAVDHSILATRDIFQRQGLNLVALLGPEHGVHGQAQDLIGVAEHEQRTRIRNYSLYGLTEESLHPQPSTLESLDVLVVDLQDIGTRYYTYQATMLYCLRVAIPMGMPVVILDRPNPIDGITIEGPTVEPGFESFVGAFPIPTRHGLTLGELALYYAHRSGWDTSLITIVPCSGWSRDLYHDQLSTPWVLPSPNMPTIETAIVYPGQCLLEGTNLSEGRGTTKPFEICGAPWIDSDKLAKTMNQLNLPGVVFRPVCFRPTFQKHAGVDCGGVQVHVIDRTKFRSLATGLALLIEMRKQSVERFRWRTEIYEFVENPIAIDLLFGSERERHAIEQGITWGEIAAEWESNQSSFREMRRDVLIYD
jgi:uncharacterized protein YbbC (DUF1343 family)